MGKRKPDMIKGTLDMLIMKVLSLEPMHGWGVCERIQEISREELQVNQGSLYASLHKLTREGWIKSYWERTENNRRARYYALTRAGEKQLGIEAHHWERLASAVELIMATPKGKPVRAPDGTSDAPASRPPEDLPATS